MKMVPAGSLVDEVWGDEQPAVPEEKAWVLEEKYAG
jgi:hypothetical protein